MQSGKCHLLEVIAEVFWEGKQLSSTLFLRGGKKRLHFRSVIYFTIPPTTLALVSEYKPTLQKKWYKCIQYPFKCFCFATFRWGFHRFNASCIRYVRLDSVHILCVCAEAFPKERLLTLGVCKHMWHITLYVHTHFIHHLWILRWDALW